MIVQLVEHGDFDRRRAVIQTQTHHLAAACHGRHHRGHDACSHDWHRAMCRLSQARQLRQSGAHKAAHFGLVAFEQVTTQEKAQCGFFLLQAPSVVPGLGRQPLGFKTAACGIVAKEAGLPGGRSLLISRLDRLPDIGQHPRAVGIQCIKGARTHERLDRATVHHPTVDPGAKIEQTGEGA